MNMTSGGCQLSEEANAIADTFQKQGDKPASMATCKRHNNYIYSKKLGNHDYIHDR